MSRKTTSASSGLSKAWTVMMPSGFGLESSAYSGNSLARLLSMASSLVSRSTMVARIASVAFASALPTASSRRLSSARRANDKVLALPNERCERPTTLGKTCRHLCERVRRACLQGPLRRLETLLACRGSISISAIRSARMSTKRFGVSCQPGLGELGAVTHLIRGSTNKDGFGACMQGKSRRPIAALGEQPARLVRGTARFGCPDRATFQRWPASADRAARRQQAGQWHAAATPG